MQGNCQPDRLHCYKISQARPIISLSLLSLSFSLQKKILHTLLASSASPFLLDWPHSSQFIPSLFPS